MTTTPDTSLKPELHKALVAYIGKVCDANDGWYNSHAVASAALWATGELTESHQEELGEFAGYIEPDDIGAEVSPSQYLTAALEYCQKQVTAWDMTEDKTTAFQTAHWILSGAEQYGLDRNKATAALLRRKPEWTEAAAAWLLDGEEGPDTHWEEVLCSPELRELMRPQLIAKAQEMDDYWNDGRRSIADWADMDEGVIALVAEAGVIPIPTQDEIAARTEAREKAAKEREAETAKFEKMRSDAAIARAEQAAEDAAEKAARDIDEVFYDAMNDCAFDDIFNDAERYKPLILSNIEEIAENFSEGNAFQPSDASPKWLIDALLKNGALVVV